MCRIRWIVKSLSLPVMIAGLLLTLCLDGFLYTSHRQNEGEIFTPYAIHRLEGIDGMVKMVGCGNQDYGLRAGG